MQVSAVNDGGMGKTGKRKTTGDKGKGKGKSKDKNKHTSSDNNKTKERDSWNSGQQRYNSKVIAHIARSGDTNAQVVGLGKHNRRTVQLWNWIRQVGALQP